MNEHRFILEPYKGMNSRYTCPNPNCRKGKTFALYIDVENGRNVSPIVGRCNREINCGYHYTPKQYFQDNHIAIELKPEKSNGYQWKPETPVKPVSYIPFDLMKSSLHSYEANNFVRYLGVLFGPEITAELVGRYLIGTSKHWHGATVFWQIDALGRVRTGKIMLYDPLTGKRVKEPYNHITWAHKKANIPDFNLQQCLFGEHLLKKEPLKPVAIVESEKTAILASAYLPQFIWLACGSLVNLNNRNCAVLKGRRVVLYPDINGFEKWKAKLPELSAITRFEISELLEIRATQEDRENGYDLADYLAQFPCKGFQKGDNKPQAILTNDDIVSMPCQTKTGEEFGNIITVWVRTRDGKGYDLFFKPNGEPLQIGEMQNEIQELATFFEKRPFPILFNGCLCWASSYC